MANAAILIIGNEILSGGVRDENSGWMASALTRQGIDVELIVGIPDRRPVIEHWIRHLAGTHDFVFTSGGIGPTPDDMTREAIGEALGLPLELHPEAHALLRRFMGASMTEFDHRMAEFPRGLRLVYAPGNPVPAFQVRNIFILPGVPGLLRRMFEAILHHLPRSTYESQTLRSTLSEGRIAPAMIEFEGRFPEVRLGSYPQWNGEDYHVDLKLEAKKAGLLDEARAWLEARLAEL